MKITEQELQQAQEITNKYHDLINQLGTLEFTLLQLKTQKEEVLLAISNTQKKKKKKKKN